MADDSSGCPDADSSVVIPTAVSAYSHSEMLCFLQNKCNVMAFDHLVKVSSDFFTRDEVYSAKQILEQQVPSNIRLPRRQGGNATKATVEDMLKAILNPAVSLPTYFAVDKTRLPPVDATHCDVSAILSELQALRAEVRASSDLREEVSNLTRELTQVREEVSQLRRQPSCSKDEVSELRAQLHSLTSSRSVLDDSEAFPPLPAVSRPSDSADDQSIIAANQIISGSDMSSDLKAFVEVARKLGSSGLLEKPAQPKKLRPPVVGSDTKKVRVKTVRTKRAIDVFVSRLHPLTTKAEIAECVNDALGGDFTNDITCDKLPVKHEHLYASFHVSVLVDPISMKTYISQLQSPESWPAGLLVRRFFPKKNG